MFRAAHGLVWEEWCSIRRVFIPVVAILAALACATALGFHIGAWNSAKTFSHIAFATIHGFILFLLLAQSTANNIQAGIPSRRYLLPVSTFALVFWPLLFRLGLVTALALVMCLAQGVLFGWTDPVLMIVCLLATLIVTTQMLAWCARLMGKWLTGLSFFLLFFPGFACLAWYVQLRSIPSPLHELLLPGCAFALALLVCTLAVGAFRRGGGTFGAWARIRDANLLNIASQAARARRPFRSRLTAQVWYEWRALGQRMTLMVCSLSCAFLALSASIARIGMVEGEEPERLFAVVLSGWYFLALILVIAGLWAFAKHQSATRQDAALFVFTRPVDDNLIVWGRLCAAGLTVCVSFAAVNAFAFGAYALSKALPAIGSGSAYFTEATAVYSGVFLALAAAWVAYTRGGFVVTCFFTFAILFASLQQYLPDTFHTLEAGIDRTMPYSALAALAAGAVLILPSFVRATQHGLLSRRAIATLLVAWGIGSAALALALQAVAPATGTQLEPSARPLVWGLAMALTLLALTPFSKVGLSVQRLRHR